MARTSTPDPQTAAIAKRLDTLVERRPELVEPITFYRAMLPLLRQAQLIIEPFSLTTETARHKIAAGLPLLIDEDLPLDPVATRDLFIRLCRIVEAMGSPSSQNRGVASFFSRGRTNSAQLLGRARNGDEGALQAMAARQIRNAVEQNQLDLLAVWSVLAAGDARSVELIAHEFKLDAKLLRMLAQNSLKPALRVWAQELKDKVDLAGWRRSQCPMCGSPPALAEIQGKESARHLRCGMCGADWPYARLRCALCGNEDHKSLGYLSVEGEEEKYRAQTCQVCRGYIKAVVTFDPTPVDLLAVEDLATLHLDLIATERGYSH